MTRFLCLLLFVSALLAAGYARATPVGAAADEGAHLHYVRTVATEGRLPVLDTRQRRAGFDDPNYEAHQPPLYYLAAAPFYIAGRAAAGETGAAMGARLASLLFGLATAWLAYRLARELLPERPYLTLAALAILCLLPMRLAIMGSASNDTAAEAAATLCLLLMARGARSGWNLRRAAWLGGALGLALLAKSSGLLLLPAAGLALLLGVRRPAAPSPVEQNGSRPGSRKRRPGKEPEPVPLPGWPARLLRAAAAALVPLLLLSGWWYIRASSLYGDPLGGKVFHWYFADTPRWADFQAGGMPFGVYLTRMVIPTAHASFWGAFGHLERKELFMGAYAGGYPPRSWLYPPLACLLVAAAAGGARWWMRHRTAVADRRLILHPGLAPAAMHAVLVFAALLQFNTIYFQAQGRYLFPAIACISLSMAGGWMEWLRRREAAVALAIAAGMLLLALYGLFGVVTPAFAGSFGAAG